MTQRCLKIAYFLRKQTFKRTEFYFGGLDLQCITPEVGFQSCEIEKDNSRDFQGKQIRTANNQCFESKVLKQKQH